MQLRFMQNSNTLFNKIQTYAIITCTLIYFQSEYILKFIYMSYCFRLGRAMFGRVLIETFSWWNSIFSQVWTNSWEVVITIFSNIFCFREIFFVHWDLFVKIWLFVFFVSCCFFIELPSFIVIFMFKYSFGKIQLLN